MSAPTRFDTVLNTSREAYLTSPLGKARIAIAKAHKSSNRLTEALNGVSTGLTVGNGSEAARRALFDALLDLRIAVGDVEALVRLVEGGGLMCPHASDIVAAQSAAITFDTSGEVSLIGLPDAEQLPDHRLDHYWRVWTDLDPFTQGYVEALFADARWSIGTALHYANDQREWKDAGFSDLSPEALGLILKDCARAVDVLTLPSCSPLVGEAFFRNRQRGLHPDFPPLTVTLGDDGKVHLAPADQAPGVARTTSQGTPATDER